MLKPVLWRVYWHDINMYARGGFPKFLLMLWPWTYISPIISYVRMRGMDQDTLRSLKTAFPFKWQVIVESK